MWLISRALVEVTCNKDLVWVPYNQNKWKLHAQYIIYKYKSINCNIFYILYYHYDKRNTKSNKEVFSKCLLNLACVYISSYFTTGNTFTYFSTIILITNYDCRLQLVSHMILFIKLWSKTHKCIFEGNFMYCVYFYDMPWDYFCFK